MVIVITGGDGGVRVSTPPSQHARITVACIVEIGELKHACKDDEEGVTTRGHYRYSTQESDETLGQGSGVEPTVRDDTVTLPLFGVMSEVTG